MVLISWRPWPGTPQTDYVGFDDDGKLKVNKQGFPTDGVLRYWGGDGMNFGDVHDPDVWLEPYRKIQLCSDWKI